MLEKVSDDRIKQRINTDRIVVNVVGSGVNTGSFSSIMTDGQEYSKNGSGINIVVHYKRLGRGIDFICFVMKDKLQYVK